MTPDLLISAIQIIGFLSGRLGRGILKWPNFVISEGPKRTTKQRLAARNVLRFLPMPLIAMIYSVLIQSALASTSLTGSAIEGAIDSIRENQKDFILCEGHCPGYLGLMALHFSEPATQKDVQQFQQCLATLISPDEILTNAHCVPPLALQKYIRVIFPKSGTLPAESIKVKELVYAADSTRTPLVDYAIFKLNKPLKRPVAKLNPKTIPEGQLVNLFTHSIQSDSKSGLNFIKLTMESCATSASAEIEGKHDVTLRSNDCTTVEGDSGGPMLTPNGDLVGIVWGGGPTSTYGLNLMCSPSSSGVLPKAVCVQSIDVAGFRLAQSIPFQEIFAAEEFGERAPVSENISGGKLFFSALACFSEVPKMPVQIQETAFFVSKQNLKQQMIPLEEPMPFVRKPVSLVLQDEDSRLAIHVLDRNSTLLSYTPERCP